MRMTNRVVRTEVRRDETRIPLAQAANLRRTAYLVKFEIDKP